MPALRGVDIIAYVMLSAGQVIVNVVLLDNISNSAGLTTPPKILEGKMKKILARIAERRSKPHNQKKRW
jgi:hypothetical protein